MFGSASTAEKTSPVAVRMQSSARLSARIWPTSHSGTRKRLHAATHNAVCNVAVQCHRAGVDAHWSAPKNALVPGAWLVSGRHGSTGRARRVLGVVPRSLQSGMPGAPTARASASDGLRLRDGVRSRLATCASTSMGSRLRTSRSCWPSREIAALSVAATSGQEKTTDRMSTTTTTQGKCAAFSAETATPVWDTSKTTCNYSRQQFATCPDHSA